VIRNIQRLRPWHSIPEARPESTADHDQSLRFRSSNLTPIDSSDDERDFKGQGAAVLGADHPDKAKSVHGHRPPMLHLGTDGNMAKHLHPVLASGDNLSPWLQPGSLQPSPIPHQLVNQFLTINGVPATTPTHGYFPAEASPVAAATQQDLHMARNMAGTNVISPGIPSPTSDKDDAIMGTPENIGDADADAEMGDFSPPSFTQTASPAPSADFAGLYQQASQVVPDNHHTSTCTAAPRRRSPLVMGYRADCNKCRCKVPGHYSHIRA
jgi:hypothetical protein